MFKILFLAANPTGTNPLHLGEEIRDIRRKIRSSAFREIRIEQEWAISPADLVTYLQEHKPTIVHFSGHGNAAGEILLQDSAGASVPVATDILADIFRILQVDIRCVVLNACFTEAQAAAISPFVDCVVGMTREVHDDAAIAFAASFYEALANSRTIREAFDLGCAMMRVLDRQQGAVPALLERSSAAADAPLVMHPELVCEFRVDRARKPVRSKDDKNAFEVRAWIRNPPAGTYSVVYQLDEEYHEHDEFNTVMPAEPNFELYFDCPYDFEIRAVLWRSEHNGIGLRTRVIEALEKLYPTNSPTSVTKAIAALKENIE